jgi:hypothetical protein
MAKRWLSFIVPVLCFASSIHAATIAYSNPAGAGNQGFSGNLALNFDVNSPITVTALGVFNADGSGFISGTIDVAIFDSGGTEVVGPVAFQGNYTPGPGSDVFQSITSVNLGPGSYKVVAVGFSETDLNGNANLGSPGPTLNTGGGALTFTGASYDSNTVLDSPTTCVGCPAAPSPQNIQFNAGTFEYETAAVSATPEPGSFALIGGGLSTLAAAVLRRRKSSR